MNVNNLKYKFIKRSLLHKWCSHLYSVLVGGILLISATHLFAQDRLIEPIEFGVKEGALKGAVSKFVQDRDGFIWMGTSKGLSRFNGSSFEHFQHNPGDSTSIANDKIITVCPDKVTGEIWVSHEDGVSVCLPEQKIFKNFIQKPYSPNGMPIQKAVSIFINDLGVVWLGFKGNGIYEYKRVEDRFEKIFFHDKENGTTHYFTAQDIQQDIFDKEKVWIIIKSGLMSFHKKNKAVSTYWIPKAEWKGKRKMSRGNSFCQMKNGSIYASFLKNGVFHIDRKTGDIKRIEDCENTEPSILEDGISAFLFPNSDHEFWITGRNSTSLYDVKSDCITYTKRIRKKRKNVSRVDFIDQQSRIWSKAGTGFNIYNPIKLNNYEFEEFDNKPRFKPSPGSIQSRSADESVAVFSLRDGLYIINHITGEQKKVLPSEEDRKEMDPFSGSANMTLLQNGTILTYSRNKLFLYRDGIDTLIQIQLPLKPSIRDIVQDEDGTVWLAHSNALYRLDMKNYTLKSCNEEITAARKKRFRHSGGDLTVDKNGNVYMLAPEGLLVFLKNKNRFIYQEYGIDLEKSKSGRSKSNPGHIKTDKKGNVFLLLNERYLGCVDLDDFEKNPIKFLDTNQEEAKVKTFVPFGDSLILIRDNGVQFFNSRSQQFGSNFSFGKTFDPPIRQASLLEDNRVAVLRTEGYFHFDPLQLKSTKSSIAVYLKHFKVRGIEEKIPAILDLEKRLELAADENFFSIKFAVKGFDFADKTTFRYKLSGVDRDWQKGTPDEFIRYTEVPGGDYPFIVEAIGANGNSKSITTIATIHIAIPWWKSLWFRALAMCSFLALAGFIYKRRIDTARKEERRNAEVKKLVAEAEMAALRAQMNPHFIFNSLNSIDYYIIKKDQETASDYLNRFSRLIRLVLKNSQKDKVSLKEDMEALQLYIELESLRFKNAFEYNINIAEDIKQEHIKIPPMLIQPYVENAIWHGLMQLKSKSGKLLLKIYKENDFLICHIEDNGIGREAAMARKSKSGSKQKSFGMKITGDRLALLNTNDNTGPTASVAINDLKNEDGSATGTKVELKIPLT